MSKTLLPQSSALALVSSSPQQQSVVVELPARLFDEFEAADMLHVKVATLRRWRWAKKGPVYHKLGALVRYSPDDLAAFVQSNRQEPMAA